MKFNLAQIMRRAWEIKRDPRHVFSFGTCLKLAWAEAKGGKRYGVNVEAVRAQVTSYIVKLMRNIRDEHDVHKLEALRAALRPRSIATASRCWTARRRGWCGTLYSTHEKSRQGLQPFGGGRHPESHEPGDGSSIARGRPSAQGQTARAS